MPSPTYSMCPIAGVVFRLLLVVSLWEGPVVWGHAHTAGTLGLARHIACLHPGDCAAANMGWHWHLSIPGHEGDDQTDGKLPTRRQSSAVVEITGLSGFASSPLSAPAPLAGNVFENSNFLHPQLAARFASTTTLPSSPQQVLCRLSC